MKLHQGPVFIDGSVYGWYGEFNRGRSSFQGEGRPKSVIVPKPLMRQLILQDRHVTYREWYTTIYLPVVFQEIRETNHRKWITIHYDNASSHTSAQTTAFLSIQNIGLMSHLPCSPDLAPNDFFLFHFIVI